MKITKASHVDHGLNSLQLAFIEKKFANETQFIMVTFELPKGLGEVPCNLHGPIMNDEPVPEEEVTYRVRGDRPGKSRLVKRKQRMTRKVSVIAGPQDDELILYTAFGGPIALREPFDPGIKEDKEALRASKEFWSKHALSV